MKTSKGTDNGEWWLPHRNYENCIADFKKRIKKATKFWNVVCKSRVIKNTKFMCAPAAATSKPTVENVKYSWKDQEQKKSKHTVCSCYHCTFGKDVS